MDEEFFVTLLSNADTAFYENTLTHYTNSLPREFDLPLKDNWHVCIKSIGFSTKFLNIITPEKSTTPGIIIVRKEYNNRLLNNTANSFLHPLKGYLRPKIKNNKGEVFYDNFRIWHETYFKSNVSIEVLQKDFDKINERRKIISVNLEEGKNVIIKPLKDDLVAPEILEPKSTLKWEIVTGENGIEDIENTRWVQERYLVNKLRPDEGKDIIVKTLPHSRWEKERYLADELQPDRGRSVIIKPMPNFMNEPEVRTEFIFLLHEKTVETFGFSKLNLRDSCNLNGEIYYIYHFKHDSTPIVGELKNWYFKYPELVRVGCDIIEEQIFDSGLDKTLSIICPKFDPDEKYYMHIFEAEEFVKVSNSNITKISVDLRNKKRKYLNLLPGPATFVKLKFKKMSNAVNFFNVRLSSKESEFEVDLPKNYYLDDKWKVALTSFNYPTDILQLPDDSASRTISVLLAEDTRSPYIEKFILPNIYYENVGALLEQINTVLHCYNSWVTYTTNPDNNLKRINFNIFNNVAIVLPVELAKMLGCEPDQHLLVETDRFVILDNINSKEPKKPGKSILQLSLTWIILNLNI